MKQADFRTHAAAKVVSALDPAFFNACCDSVRLELIRHLVVTDSADIGDLAKHFAQDRSVISRHLAILARAGVVLSQKSGRHVVYALNGPEILARFETLTSAMQDLTQICCPTDERTKDEPEHASKSTTSPRD